MAEKAIEKLKKGGEIKPKKKGGKRQGSGRKPKEANLIARGIKNYLDKHFTGDAEIQITDPKSGEKRIISKPRIVAALEKLFSLGMKGEGDADALNKWLDRALGKAPQSIVLGGKIESSPEEKAAATKAVEALTNEFRRYLKNR